MQQPAAKRQLHLKSTPDQMIDFPQFPHQRSGQRGRRSRFTGHQIIPVPQPIQHADQARDVAGLQETDEVPVSIGVNDSGFQRAPHNEAQGVEWVTAMDQHLPLAQRADASG